jgi:predicted Zn-dependent protease
LRANRADEAIAPLQKADELWPQTMACMSLAIIFDRKGQLDEAERYWKRATSLDQERIEWWKKLELVLSGRLKFKEASDASDRARFLEELYRSR